MAKTLLCFDLDGTIIDPTVGQFDAFRHSLAAVGIDPPTDATLRNLVGPPLHHGYREQFGMDDKTVNEAVQVYRERFSKVGLEKVELYPGMKTMLESLSTKYELAITTSKLDTFARRILDLQAIHDLFSYISASNPNIDTPDKATIIQAAITVSGAHPENTVVIGDRHHDINGGRSNGTKTIGVLWGFGSKEELVSAGADSIVETPTELLRNIDVA